MCPHRDIRFTITAEVTEGGPAIKLCRTFDDNEEPDEGESWEIQCGFVWLRSSVSGRIQTDVGIKFATFETSVSSIWGVEGPGSCVVGYWIRDIGDEDAQKLRSLEDELFERQAAEPSQL